MGCIYSDLLDGKCTIHSPGDPGCDEDGFCVCEDDEDPTETCEDFNDGDIEI